MKWNKREERNGVNKEWMGHAHGCLGVSLFSWSLSLQVNQSINQKGIKSKRDGTKTQSFQIRAPKHNSIIQWALTQLGQSNAQYPNTTLARPRAHPIPFHSIPLLRSLTVSIRQSTLSESDVSRFHTGVFGSTTSSFITRHSGSCTNGQFWTSVISVCTRSWQIG